MKQHYQFFELFRQYNEKIFESLINRLEKIRFSIKNMILIKAIHNMIVELFNIDIFKEISSANMLSFQGFSENNTDTNEQVTFSIFGKV